MLIPSKETTLNTIAPHQSTQKSQIVHSKLNKTFSFKELQTTLNEPDERHNMGVQTREESCNNYIQNPTFELNPQSPMRAINIENKSQAHHEHMQPAVNISSASLKIQYKNIYQSSLEDEDEYKDFIRNSNVLPMKFYQLVEQNKQQTQDYEILKPRPVELKVKF